MRWRDFDLGAVFAFLLASAYTVITLPLLFITRSDPGSMAIAWSIYIVTAAASWFGFWAWLRKRWLVAAASFFVSIAWPGGFFVMLSAPIAFGLFVVSLIRAWVDRPSRRRSAAGGVR